jgi:hypothetical protein
MYLDYEGPISAGRGTIECWDRGTFQVELWNDDGILVQLAGEKLAGRVELRRQAGLWRFEWKTGNLKTGR